MGFSLTPWSELIISIIIFIGVDYYFEVVGKHSAVLPDVINAVIGFLFLGAIADQMAPIVELLEIIAYVYLLVKNRHVMNLITGKKSTQKETNFRQDFHNQQSPQVNNASVQHNNFQRNSYQRNNVNNQRSSTGPNTNLNNRKPSPSDNEDKELKRNQLAQIKKANEMMKSSKFSNNTDSNKHAQSKTSNQNNNHGNFNKSTLRSAQLAQIRRAKMMSKGKSQKASNSSSGSNDLNKYIH